MSGQAWRVDLDGQGEPTLWTYPTSDTNTPIPVIRRCDVPATVWLLAELLADDSPTGAAVRHVIRGQL